MNQCVDLIQHTGENVYDVGNSGECIDDMDSLNNNVVTHKDLHNQYDCGICGIAFSISDHTKTHFYTHTKEAF